MAEEGKRPEETEPEDSSQADEGEPSDDQDERSDDQDSDDRSAAETGGDDEDFHPTAPSLGPHTEIEREPVEERLARHEQSDVDAMGKDKRRAVIGQSYGPSVARQATLYGIAVAAIILLAIGFKLLVSSQDKFPSKVEAKAPWSQQDARQVPPKPLQ